MKSFCNLKGSNSLISVITLFKNLNEPTCIDLILTNKPSHFQHSSFFETGLSDFHLLTVTEFNMGFQKQMPKIINYYCNNYCK